VRDSAFATAARAALLAGAAGSVLLMLRAGARQRSVVLILLFTGWLLSPFLALALANLRARAWAPHMRAAVHSAMIGVSCLSLAIYGLNAVYTLGKAGFIYLVVPAGDWLLIGLTLGAAAALRRVQ
jgi:hypothetical protein